MDAYPQLSDKKNPATGGAEPGRKLDPRTHWSSRREDGFGLRPRKKGRRTVPRPPHPAYSSVIAPVLIMLASRCHGQHPGIRVPARSSRKQNAAASPDVSLTGRFAHLRMIEPLVRRGGYPPEHASVEWPHATTRCFGGFFPIPGGLPHSRERPARSHPRSLAQFPASTRCRCRCTQVSFLPAPTCRSSSGLDF